ncbi:hypothetical protein KKA09_02805 [Patescibacteria group bacterium]|nr:hypothetical protein [Patescibacteria group bacterium]
MSIWKFKNTIKQKVGKLDKNCKLNLNKNNMDTITIPQKMIKGDDLIIIPRRKYEKFLNLEKIIRKKLDEEADIDMAIQVYKKEKLNGKLKTIKSLTDLD